MSTSASLSAPSLISPLAPALPALNCSSKGHLGRLHGRAIICRFRNNERISAGTEGDLQETSEQRQRTMHVKSSRRELVLKSSSAAVLAALINFSGTRPDNIGLQNNPPSLALCPPTPCISTSEELNDPGHYVPPWSYNPPDGRGRKNPASKEKAMAELIEVVQKTKPDNFTPRIVTSTEDYVYVEYESPLPFFKFVDDVEFWFPPGNRSIVEYRSASRVGQNDFDANRKRIRALRQALEKKGWESVGY